MDKNNSVVIAAEKQVGEVAEGIEVKNGDRQRLDLGGEHAIQCTDDALQNYAPETCIIVLTGVTPINAIRRKKIKTMLRKKHEFHK